jgi:hypothetical protein
MSYTGTITRIQRTREGVTLIVQTDYGLRGIEVDRDIWIEILNDLAVEQESAIIGWGVEYDPANGDLDLFAPDVDDGTELE